MYISIREVGITQWDFIKYQYSIVKNIKKKEVKRCAEEERIKYGCLYMISFQFIISQHT